MSAGVAVDRVTRGFDRIAPAYDAAAAIALAGRIHRSQTALLPLLPPIARALVVGGGSGRFLEQLLSGGRVGGAVAIDASSRMTRRAAARLRRGDHAAIDLRVGGLERLDETERFDLVVTHCFLDLFDAAEFSGVVARLDAALEPGGLWLFSDFSVEGPGLPRFLRRLLVTALYLGFRLVCGIAARRLPDFDRAFAHLGYREISRRRFAGGLLCASLYRKPALEQNAR